MGHKNGEEHYEPPKNPSTILAVGEHILKKVKKG